MKGTYDRLIKKMFLHPHSIEDVNDLQAALDLKQDIGSDIIYIGSYWAIMIEAVTHDLVLYKNSIGYYYGWEEVHRWSFADSTW